MDKKTNFNAWYIVVAVLGMLLLQAVFQQARETERLPYSEFRKYLEQGKLDDLLITETRITGTIKNPAEGEPGNFVTTRIDPAFAQELEKQGVTFRGGSDENFFTTLLSWVLPALIFFGIWIFLMRRMAGGGLGAGGLMSIGKSRAKIYVEKDTKTTLADVAGVDEAKAEVQEIIDFLKDPKGYGVLGARLPRGVLLVGPPGTGKTLLARAVAGEAGVTFLSISGSEFVEMFVGVGAARVRDLFEQARKMAPCIIFIDELDALGRARGLGPMAGGHDEKEQTLNQLLVELDGFDPSQGIILLAATNRPEILDPALLRPGRFDRQILVDRPDKQGRIQILQVHVKKIKLGPERQARAGRGADAGLHRRRSREPGQRGGAARDAPARPGGDHGRLQQRDRADRRRPGEEEPPAQSQGAPDGRVPRARPRAGRAVAAGRRPGAQGVDHPARRRGARLHHAAADRGPLPDDRRRSSRTRWPCCSAGAPRSSWCSARSRPAPPTTW